MIGKNLIGGALIVSTLFSGASYGATSLLANGDAEPGHTGGWSVSSPNIQAVQIAQGNKPLPPFGNYFFSFSEKGTPDIYSGGSMVQQGAIGDAPQQLTLSGMFATEWADYGTAVLSLYDASDTLLASTASGPLTTDPANFVWTPFELSLNVLPTTSYWEVTLGAGLATGGRTNVYLDDLALTASPVPLPATLPLFVFAAAGLGCLGRRGKRLTPPSPPA